MKLGTSQRGTGVPALVAFMVLAGVGVALAGMPEPAGLPEPTPSVSPSSPGRSGHHGETPGVKPSPSTDPLIVEACTTALETGEGALERQHGLDRAIGVILENCGKSPQATGLLTALGHLEANQARQEANQELQKHLFSTKRESPPIGWRAFRVAEVQLHRLWSGRFARWEAGHEVGSRGVADRAPRGARRP